MPYRRLPTTDKARMRALNAALGKVIKNERKLAFSNHSVEQLQNVKNNFENHLTQYELDTRLQAENIKDYKEAFDRAKMYVSHFTQVLLFASERGEINGGIKFYEDLASFEGKVPPLNTEEEVLKWGKIMVEGEQKRMQNGGSAIYNPSIALVKFKVQELHDASVFQQTLKRNTLRSFEKMQNLRKTTNDFISKLWTEIEEGIEAESPKVKRQLAQEYGIVYVFRRNEKKKMNAEEMQTDLLFEFA
ncbi:hypothetical protein [uncultured Draconibacterium sp.]|uniref:hypothetical protein n=1 Tax=uncultured Draconibacterium sp. TaxID=1573823 RepID=UPI003260FE83